MLLRLACVRGGSGLLGACDQQIAARSPPGDLAVQHHPSRVGVAIGTGPTDGRPRVVEHFSQT
jgi:hypothetical protein